MHPRPGRGEGNRAWRRSAQAPDMYRHAYRYVSPIAEFYFDILNISHFKMRNIQ
jgi:hypothetical protein